VLALLSGVMRRAQRKSAVARKGHSRLAVAAFGLALGVAGAGCYPKAGAAPGELSAASVTWATGRWSGTTADSLAAGRRRFLAKCNGCHNYPDFGAIAEERWPTIVERMAHKANLGAEERELVLRFVLVSRFEQAGRR
jgi:hypothetical protein